MEAFTYKVQIHPAAEGGYWAEVPALPGCFTQAETVEEVAAMAEEAILVYLGGLAARGQAFPVEKQVKQRYEFPVTVRAPRLA